MKGKKRPSVSPATRMCEFTLDAFNVLGKIFSSMGLKIGKADADFILRKAMKRSGVNTIFDDSFIDPLNLLIKNVNEQTNFKLSGQLLFRGFLIHRVSNRLQIDAALDANPEILKQPVERPIVIAALPRTGTTLLHRLFAQDSALRVPLFWEMQYPCPPPNIEASGIDPRIVQVDKEIAIVNRLVPQFKGIHETGTFLPEECIMLFANDLIGDYFTVFCQLPDYDEWLLRQNFCSLYGRHKKQLQLLQYRHPQKRWVLKAPSHLRALLTLTHTYPDVCIIQTHRDPGEIIASTASLSMTARSFFQYNIRPEIVGKGALEGLGQIIEKSMFDRDQIELNPNSRVRFIDVMYEDIVKNPIETMRSVYAQCDLAWSHSIEQQTMAYLEENRQHRHGKHQHSLEDFGLKKEQVDQRFAAYNKRFLK